MEDKKSRIKIEDLPRDMKVSREEMRKVLGGFQAVPPPERQDRLLLHQAWWIDDRK